MPRLTRRSVRTYTQFQEALDEALAEGGVRYKFNSYGEAVKFRQQCNNYRVIDRNLNCDTYPPEHPRWGTSVYDDLELSIPKKGEPNDSILTIKIRPRFVYAKIDEKGNPVIVEKFGPPEDPLLFASNIATEVKSEPKRPPSLHSNKPLSTENLDLGPEVDEPGTKPPDV